MRHYIAGAIGLVVGGGASALLAPVDLSQLVTALCTGIGVIIATRMQGRRAVEAALAPVQSRLATIEGRLDKMERKE